MAVPVLKYAIGNGASTTGTTAMTASSTSVDLSNTTNFQAAPTPGEGMVILDEGTASEEYAYATGLSSSTLSIPLANRGLEGTSATSHTANSMTIKGTLTQDMWNDVITTLSNGFSRTTGAVDTTKILVPSVLDTDGTLAANSDSKIATQKATKTYVDSALPTSAWSSYTPTWTNITTGNGTNVGKYITLGKTVHFIAYFIMGSTSSISGNISVTTPSTMTTNFYRSGATEVTVGNACFLDSGSAAYPGSITVESTTAVTVRAHNASATYLTLSTANATAPFTFATSDEIWVMGTYEKT